MFGLRKLKSREGSAAVGLLLVAIIIAVIALVPHVFIWSINALFDQNIAHGLKQWFAAFVMLMLIGGSSAGGSRS
jgi:uncharacterized membrane protein YjjP (DUF1212 family)